MDVLYLLNLKMVYLCLTFIHLVYHHNKSIYCSQTYSVRCATNKSNCILYSALFTLPYVHKHALTFLANFYLLNFTTLNPFIDWHLLVQLPVPEWHLSLSYFANRQLMNLFRENDQYLCKSDGIARIILRLVGNTDGHFTGDPGSGTTIYPRLWMDSAGFTLLMDWICNMGLYSI